jgi:hypothetical protein
MNNELGRIWKKEMVVYTRHFLNGLGKMTKTSVRIAGVLAEIPT